MRLRASFKSDHQRLTVEFLDDMRFPRFTSSVELTAHDTPEDVARKLGKLQAELIQFGEKNERTPAPGKAW